MHARLASTTAAPLRRPWHPLQMLTQAVRLQACLQLTEVRSVSQKTSAPRAGCAYFVRGVLFALV